MRRWLAVLLGIVLFFPSAAKAVSIGGADTQGKGKLSIGAESEYVTDRDLKIKSYPFVPDAGQAFDSITGGIDSMFRDTIKASYGIFDFLDIYLKVGWAKSNINTDYTTNPNWSNHEAGSIDFKEPGALAYGLGFKGKHELRDGWFIGADVQYIRQRSSFKCEQPFSTYNGSGVRTSVGSDSMRGKMIFQEWQFAPYLAKKINNFTPYLGGTYTKLRINGKVTTSQTNSLEFKNKQNAGVFAGLDYDLTKNIRLNLEGRFIDETGGSIATTYRF